MSLRLPDVACALGLALLACDRASPIPDEPSSEGPVAIIMVMDGVRVQESLGEEASSITGEPPSEFMPETWENLVPQGVRATNAWNLAATVTAPAHVSMVTGRRLPVANYPASEEVGVYRPTLPTLMETLRAADPTINRRMAFSVANTQLLKTLGHSIWPGYGYEHSVSYLFVHNGINEAVPGKDDHKVARFLKRRLERGSMRFALVNLHQVDRSSHYGEEQDYPDRVRQVDEIVSSFWTWLQHQDQYQDNTWMVLAADHGRHLAASTEPPWRHHGCSCNGCRHIPLLLLGPGVKANQDIDDPVLLVDVAPTLGALMGVSMPWADGMVRDDLLDQPTGFPSRSGLADLALARSLRAELRYLQDPAHRSELVLGGQRLSSPDAIAAEAPVLAASGQDAWLCFRELTLHPEGDETSWIPRCLASDDAGASWTDIGFAHETAGPYWRLSLLPDELGGLVAAYGYNPHGLANEGTAVEGGVVAVEIARFDGEAWIHASAETDLSFPTDASVLSRDGGWYLAVGAGQPDAAGVERNTRTAHVARVDALADGFTWTEPVPVDLRDLGADDPWWRLEYPALFLEEGGRLWLAASGFTAQEGMAVLAASDDGGETWPTRGIAELPGRIMPHLGPVWLEGRPVWATVAADSQAASLCAGQLWQQPDCVDAGTERILQLRVVEDEVTAIVDVGTGEWEARSWQGTDFSSSATARWTPR